MQTSNVDIPVDGKSMPSYFAVPDAGPRPAVIVLQEIFGVDAEMRRITELLASNGYVGLAINYYHRTDPDLHEPYTPEGMERGFAVAAKTGRATYRADIAAAVSWLQARPEVAAGRIAAWGFCMGGSVAFLSATMPGIKAAICFYGASIAAPFASGEPEALADVDMVTAPLLLTFGGQDPYIKSEAVDRITKTLQDAGKEFEVKVYSDQSHGFFRESSAAMNSVDVRDAWTHVQRFLTRV